MVKFATSLAIASMATCANAFIAPTSSSIVSRINTNSDNSIKMSFENEIGAQPPLGFWDPLGVLFNADQERFDKLRYTEIKHGRIAMLAIVGHMVTTAGVRLPFAYDLAGDKYADVPAGLAAFNKLPTMGLVQVFAFIGLMELGFDYIRDEIEADCEAKMDSFGWDQKTKDRKRAIELNNGRAAQMGILGLMVHEMLDNNPYVLNSMLGFPVDFNAGF